MATPGEKRKADDDATASIPKRAREAAMVDDDDHRYPHAPFHYRFHCGDNPNWQGTSSVCPRCVCWICGLSFQSGCRTIQHKWAAPRALCAWESMRCAPAADARAIAVPHHTPMVKIVLHGVRLNECVYHFGAPAPHVAAYMKTPAPAALWRAFEGMSISTTNPDGERCIRAIRAATKAAGRFHKTDVGRMYRPAALLPSRAIAATLTLEHTHHGNYDLAVQVYVPKVFLDIGGVSPELIRIAREHFAEEFSRVRCEVNASELVVPPCADGRVLMAHQKKSLARMIHQEKPGGLAIRLWRKYTNGVYVNERLRSVAVGCEPADTELRGGLLCNDRGHGKTCVVAALIATRQAAITWLQEEETAPAPPPPPPPPAPAADEPAPEYPTSDDERESDAEEGAGRGDDWAQHAMMHAWQSAPTRRVKTTLVVVPDINLVAQWIDELERFGLRVVVHHGKTKVRDVDEFADADVLLTTNKIVQSAVKGDADGCADGIFTRVRFWRVVVDEVHKLLGQGSLNKTGSSMLWIRAVQRWGLTATPNPTPTRFRRYAMLLFGSPTERTDKAGLIMNMIGHPGRNVFRDHGVVQSTLHQAIRVLYKPADEEIPQVEEHMRPITLSGAARNRYQHAYRECRKLVRRAPAQATLRMLNQLLICLSGGEAMRIPTDADAVAELAGDGSEMVPEDIFDCAICMDQLAGPVKTDPCGHYFCHDCIKQWMRQSPACPMCRTPIGARLIRCAEVVAPEAEAAAAGPAEAPEMLEVFTEKIDAVVEQVAALAFEEKTDALPEPERAPNRILVFSRFPKVRKEIVRRLKEVTTVTTQLDDFRTGDDAVLVLSSTACAVGLNLMMANHEVLCEAPFRETAAQQMIARAARLGQKRKVHVHRFYAEGTVEERVQAEARNEKVRLRHVFEC